MASMEGSAMAKYQWPASLLGEDEMKKLFEASRDTGKPITLLIREAVREVYGG